MYDTSDIRKGLKVLMDGQPFTIVAGLLVILVAYGGYAVGIFTR